jgi:hypothetical protein
VTIGNRGWRHQISKPALKLTVLLRHLSRSAEKHDDDDDDYDEDYNKDNSKALNQDKTDTHMHVYMKV